MSTQTLLILGAVFLLGRRSMRRRPAPASPPGWGAPAPGSVGRSAKRVVVIAVIAAALLTGITLQGAGAAGRRSGSSGSGPTLAGILGALTDPQLSKKLPKLLQPGASTPSPKAGSAVRYALGQIGDRYVYGANGPHAWDCSSLTRAAWKRAGVAIPRTAAEQLAKLPKARGKLRAGDLLIYNSAGSPSGRHVAMVAGPGRVVEARGRRSGVTTGRLRGGYLGAVRPGGR
jgi:NlpC/P60 family protein